MIITINLINNLIILLKSISANKYIYNSYYKSNFNISSITNYKLLKLDYNSRILNYKNKFYKR